MFTSFFFSRMNPRQQIKMLRRKGIILGTRVKDGRKVYIYMLKDLFAEVLYKNDNADDEAEKISILRGLDNLNNYLENEFRASF